MFDGVKACRDNGHDQAICETTCKDVGINHIARGAPDLLKCLPSGSVDAIVTTKALFDAESVPAMWHAELYRALRKGGMIFAFAQNENYPAMAIALERAGFTTRDVISWLQWSADPDPYHLKPAHVPIYVGLKKAGGKRLKDLGIVFNIDDVRIPYRDAKDKAIAQYGADGFAKRLKQPQQKYLDTGWGMRRIHDYQVNVTGRYPTNVASEAVGDPYIQGKFVDIAGLESAMINEPAYSLKEASAGAKRRVRSQNRRGAKGTFLKGMATMTQGVNLKGVHPRNVITARDLADVEEQFVHEPKEKHSQHHKGTYTRQTNSTFFKDGMVDSHQAHPIGRFPANVVTQYDTIAGGNEIVQTHYDPAQMVEWILKLATTEGGVVLDPAVGSGAVVDGARRLGRAFIGFRD